MVLIDSWSEDYDRVPLGLRMKMLHSIRNRKYYENIINANPIEIGNCSSTVLITNSELPSHQASDNSSSCYSVDYPENLDMDAEIENSSNCSSVPGIVLQDCLMGSSSANMQVSDAKHENIYEFDESLDTVVLGERRKMLLSRKQLQYPRSDTRELDNRWLPNSSQVMLQTAEHDSIEDTLNLEVHGCDNLAVGNATTANKFSEPMSASSTVSIMSRCLPLFGEHKSFDAEDLDMKDASALANSILPLPTKVKNEPCDTNEFCSEQMNVVQNSIIGPTNHVKNEPGLSEFLLDELDHMSLVKRLNLLSSRLPGLDVSGNPEYVKEDVASGLDYGDDVLESVKPISISRPRKKRRTATDSVETALEEDVPGLLKVLLDRGVSAEEIKLYGEDDPDDALDDAFSEDGFAELEAVVSQLFSQRQTFLKFPLLRTKGVKVNYCLSCLLSLVEQTRYLRNRKWPVEWGWCRDLQSFIFVFQRHNRIVLEHPEYGFATYFFELLNSVPVAWQIKRLVIAMKLTSCGRITLIENKPLVVGEDLSEGEAQVLAEYGWTPNTGLGTMLNYCDRVVHDRKQELDSSEWRLKIGRQLMNGYNGGNLVANNLPKRLSECQDLLNVQVKLEEE